MDCTEVLEKLGDYLDEDARAELCKAIESHLRQCNGCRFEVDTLKKTITLYQADREMNVPVSVSASLQKALAKEYGQGG